MREIFRKAFLYTRIMINYDQKLIDEAKEYFTNLYGRKINSEEAESYLKSLVYLLDSLSEFD